MLHPQPLSYNYDEFERLLLGIAYHVYITKKKGEPFEEVRPSYQTNRGVSCDGDGPCRPECCTALFGCCNFALFSKNVQISVSVAELGLWA